MKILVLSDFHGKFPKRLQEEAKKVDIIISLGDYIGVEGWDDYLIEMFKGLKNKTGYLTPEKYYGEKKYRVLEKKSYEDMKEVLLCLNKIGKPVYTIMGNYDWPLYHFPFQRNFSDSMNYQKWFKKLNVIKSFNYKIMKINGVEVLGFGGYMDDESHLPNRNDKDIGKKELRKLKRFEKTKKRFLEVVNKMKPKGIFVLHYPPASKFGIVADKKNAFVGENVGIKFFRDAIKEKKPYFVLCGHMHEHQGMMKIDGVPIISVGCASGGKACIVDFDFEEKKLTNVKFIK